MNSNESLLERQKPQWQLRSKRISSVKRKRLFQQCMYFRCYFLTYFKISKIFYCFLRAYNEQIFRKIQIFLLKPTEPLNKKKRIPQNIEILHVKHTKQGLKYFNIGYWIFCSSIFTNLPSNGVVRIQLSYDVYRETFYKTKKLKNQLFGLASSWTFIKLF